MLKNLIYIVSFTAFVALVWIFLSIYHNITSTTISSTTALQIDPIDPTFDTKTISQLTGRINVSSDLSGSFAFPTSVPSFPTIGTGSAKGPIPTPGSIASQEAPIVTLTPTPTPTTTVITPTPTLTGPTPTPTL